MARKTFKSLIPFYLGGLMVCVTLVFVALYLKQNAPVTKRSVDTDKVCLTRKEYDELQKPKEVIKYVSVPPTAPSPPVLEAKKPTDVQLKRDYQVLHDPLYPPLNRTDAVNHKNMEVQVDRRNMYVPINDIGDQFRLVGYVVSDSQTKDQGGNSWKLFARQKDKNISEFYMSPSNNNYDIKIFITDDMVVGTRLRDLYTIPNEITFKHPMLNATVYKYIELPKNDLNTSRYM